MSSSIDRLLRANRTIMLVPIYTLNNGTVVIVSPTGTTCPLSAPTSAVLDAWRSVLTTSATGGAHGGNISCATLDDVTLGLDASQTDTELTICSVGNEATPAFAKVNIKANVLRDKNKADTGVFNLATRLLNGADITYGWVDRLGRKSTDAFVVTDIVSIYSAATDTPIDHAADRANLKLEQNPVPDGNFITNYALAS